MTADDFLIISLGSIGVGTKSKNQLRGIHFLPFIQYVDLYAEKITCSVRN